MQWQEAQRQKTQAEANFKRARETVDGFFTRVSESTLLNQPGLEPLRRQLLEKALNYYQDLAKQRAEDPEMQADLAAVVLRTGNIRQLLGDHSDVETAYRQAIAHFSVLVQVHPEAPAYRSDLATSHHNLGNLLRDGGDAAGAQAAYQRAIDLRERLARGHPEAPTYRSDLATSYHNLGNLLSDGGDRTGAQAAYQKARNLRERLAREYLLSRGVPERLGGEPPQPRPPAQRRRRRGGARAAYQKAIDLQERLAREHPEVPAYRSDLAGNYGSLAWAELFARHPREAIAAANRGLEIDPDQVWIRTNLAHGYLFDNQYAKALAIYTENKDVKLDDGRTFAEAVLADFKELRAKGLDHPDMAKIEQLLRGSGAEGQ